MLERADRSSAAALAASSAPAWCAAARTAATRSPRALAPRALPSAADLGSDGAQLRSRLVSRLVLQPLLLAERRCKPLFAERNMVARVHACILIHVRQQQLVSVGVRVVTTHRSDARSGNVDGAEVAKAIAGFR